MLEGTYTELLDEGIDLVLERKTYVPPPLLPALLQRAAALMEEDFPRARTYVRAGGRRANWLAERNPDWAELATGFDYVRAWRATDQPSHRAKLLARWRFTAPDAAREALAKGWSDQSPRNQEILLEGMAVGLSAADHSWLRESLSPKRKGVRRVLTALLLRAGEPEAIADLGELARAIVSEGGDLRTTVVHAEHKELLKKYGGLKAPQTLDQWLLEIMPPSSWDEWVKLKPPTWWLSLKPLQVRSVGRAVATFDNPGRKVEFLDFLLRESPPQFPAELGVELVRQLPDAAFDRLYESLLTDQRDALRLRGLPRWLALNRRSAWSERLTRAMVRRLLDDLENRQLDYATQRDLALHWKLATPLLHPAVFSWLRQQLHSATERYDAFGKLATTMLQTTAFRRELSRT
nr:DUF5691 domain-containing protein [Lewinella sp. JB7]